MIRYTFQMNTISPLDARFDAALQLAQAGEYDRAEDACRTLLAASPRHADALNLLGVLCTMRGEYASAVDFLRRAIGERGDVAKFHGNLGNAYRGQGLLEEAFLAYRRALALDPAFFDAAFNEAVALEEARDWGRAAAAYRQALGIRARAHEAHNNLGRVLQHLGRLEEAIPCFREAVALAPAEPGYSLNLGMALRAMDRPEEALPALRHALALRPGYAEALKELGDTLQALGQGEEAIAAYERALASSPQDAGLVATIAFQYEQGNRIEDAKRMVAQGLKFAPHDAFVNVVAAKLERRAEEIEQAVDRLNGVKRENLPREVAAVLHHELGQLHERLQDSAAAFRCFAEGKRHQRAIALAQGADKNAYLQRVDRYRAFFTPEWVEAVASRAMPPSARAPVFLIGFPRSGTTLLDQILDSHPRLQTIEERPMLRCVLDHIETLPGGYPQALARLSDGEIEECRELYFQFAGQYLDLDPDKRVVDKFPLNIIHAPLIWRIFPNAQFILALRHPCDCCLSCFMHLFGINHAMSNFFSLEDAAVMYAKVMGLWRHYQTILPLKVHVIRYEDVVADLERESRALIEFLGLEWDESVLRYHEHARQKTIHTPSYHQVTEPIYRRAAYRWQRYAEHFAPVTEALAPFIRDFGYASAGAADHS